MFNTLKCYKLQGDIDELTGHNEPSPALKKLIYIRLPIQYK